MVNTITIHSRQPLNVSLFPAYYQTLVPLYVDKHSRDNYVYNITTITQEKMKVNYFKQKINELSL